MQPLLRIQSVPIKLDYSSKRASLEISSSPPTATVTRTKGRADIRTEPIKINIDSYETRASAGLKSARRSIEEFADTGKTDAVKATRDIVEQGNNIVDSHGRGNPIVDNAMSKVMTTHETIMSFIPSVRPQMSTEGGTINFDYSMDRLDYQWNVQPRPTMEFVPGSIEFTVAQYPEVIVEYVGGPHYVPASADPNYEGPVLDTVG